MSKKSTFTTLVIYPETSIHYERREFVKTRTTSPVCFQGEMAGHHYFSEFPEVGEKCFCGMEKYEEKIDE